ncbi:MAG: thermonuclease family protein [Acidimicrobiales bacterium]
MILFSLLVALISACSNSGFALTSDESWALEANAIVAETIDGDTIRVDLVSGTEVVRLLGIDTPETVDPRRPEQCFGSEASSFLAQLLPTGTPIRLERDRQARDTFGRLLAYVHRAPDGLFINHELLAGGYADTLSIEPNTTFRSEFDVALRTARAERRGLWGQCDGPDQPLSEPGEHEE